MIQEYVKFEVASDFWCGGWGNLWDNGALPCNLAMYYSIGTIGEP